MSQLPPKQTKSSNALTARQQEILRLLCEGRSNKDIADKLDISLGTVKQHLVGLFKKMNVSNRAMAVSQGMARQGIDKQGDINATDNTSTKGFLLRPCIALSIGLNPDCDTDFARLLHKTLAGLAFDSRAYFLERGRYSADMVLGLKHYAENTIVSSIQICLMLQQELQFHSIELLDKIRIGFSISMAVVQKDRFSQDSSSDLVASPVINDSRQLMESGSWGSFYVSDTALAVLNAAGLAVEGLSSKGIKITELTKLFIIDEDSSRATYGRDNLLNQLISQTTTSQQKTALIEGENGLGKTHVCKQLLQHFSAMPSQSVSYYQALPIQPLQFIDAINSESLSHHQLLSSLEAFKNLPNQTTLIDDFHLVPKSLQIDFIELAKSSSGNTFFFGRHLKSLAPDNTLSLSKLYDADIEQIVASIEPETKPENIKQILEESRGVPLFATELARHQNQAFPLSLLMIVASRLDAFQLDWQLLHTLSQGAKATQLTHLKAAMGSDEQSLNSSIEMASKVGVISCKGEGEQTWISFQHPLIRKVIKILSANWSEAQHGI